MTKEEQYPVGKLDPARKTRLTDKEHPPSRDGLADHQHWVWMSYPHDARWEVRGTGVLRENQQKIGAPDGGSNE